MTQRCWIGFHFLELMMHNDVFDGQLQVEIHA